MSNPTAIPSLDEIKNHLNQIGLYLFKADKPLVPEQKPSAHQVYLDRLNDLLKNHRKDYLTKSRALYQTLENSDLHSEAGETLIATLKASLKTQLRDLDDRTLIGNTPARAFMINDAGLLAITHQARQAVSDRLLHPQNGALLENIGLGPQLRPGLYALQFTYQEKDVELAGAFVVTEKNSPVAGDLQAEQNVGSVVLFTPSRGIESFESLSELDSHLRQIMDRASTRDEWLQMLPTRYQGVGTPGMWPLKLMPIDAKPLFEHTCDAMIDKRWQDIEQALSFVDNPRKDTTKLLQAMDRAVEAALPDLTSGLELRAQTLLERVLSLSAPNWYTSASEPRQAELARHLESYNKAQHDVLTLLGPALSPQTLARQQWLDRLSDDLQIDDLEPQSVLLTTRRTLTGLGSFEQDQSLIDLALQGLHTGDELPGSSFLKHTSLTCLGKPLADTHPEVTPEWLVQQALTLQPRVDFAQVQKQAHEQPAIKQAIEHMFDQRIQLLACTAPLQGHLLDSDLQLIRQLRADEPASRATLQAATLSLHGAQFKDLWALRQSDETGTIKRILLCIPDAPGERQFLIFDSVADCQAHILAAAHHDKGVELGDHLLSRLPARFQQSMRKMLSGLGFKPADREHEKVTFEDLGTYSNSLHKMAEHLLATQVDNYDYSTPLWYRSASAAERRQLSTLSVEAEGLTQVYHAHPLSEKRLPTFDAYLHAQARESLNRLLGRPANDVDPDTVWALPPRHIIGSWTAPPINYTQLYRDGYEDGLGLIHEKFSTSARFEGPSGVDLSNLTAEKVARSVTGVWIGERYTAKVRDELQSATSPGYAYRRDMTLAIARRQMQNAAIECQLRGHIVSLDRQWLEQCLEDLGDTSEHTRNTYKIHRLMIDGEWVIDTWLFSHEQNPVLLYTPDAPDGVSFREARLFNHVLKKQEGMIGYFADRVAVQSRARVRAFLETARAQLPDSIDKTTFSIARYDSTRSVPVVTDMRYALYNMKLQRKIDNVHATTVSQAQMISNLLWSCVEWAVAIATIPFPVWSLAGGMLLAFKDGMLALHAYRQGDNAAALQHLAGYLFNSAGALVTDLRPALRSLKLLPALERKAIAEPAKKSIVALTEQLELPAPTWVDMQAVSFQGQLYWTTVEPDALGRFLLYRLDPTSGKPFSTGRLVTRDAERGWIRSGVSGGGPKYEPVSQTPGPITDYGVTDKYRELLESAMNPQTRLTLLGRENFTGLGSAIDNAVVDLAPVRHSHLKQVERLTLDASRFFDDMAPLAARPQAPAIDSNMSFVQFLGSDAFAGNKPLVIGALPGSVASKQLLIESMQALIDKGFKRLYLEYLPGDVFHIKLAKFNRGESWLHIKSHLKAIDEAMGHGKKSQFSYVQLMQAAQDKGMKVMALDSSSSYLLDDVLLMADVPPTLPRPDKIRNFYSHKVITADTNDAADERWIALVAPSRMVTVDNTPGLADLHNAVALRVDDVALGQPVTLRVDTPGNIPGAPLAKGDYHLALPSAYKAPQTSVSTAPVAGPSARHYAEFDMPPAMRDDISRQGSEPKGLDSRYAPNDPERRATYSVFLNVRERLDNTAKTFFAGYTPPARPPLPSLPPRATTQDLLQHVANNRLPGLVLGESHSMQSAKALLIEQMAAFKNAGYKTLYIEHLLTDLHQQELDVFLRTQHMPDRLRDYLRAQDGGQMPNYRGTDTYTAVIQAAGKQGIRIRALDCAASYHVKGLAEDASRFRMFSYHASQVINADQLAEGPHKWIAFVGNSHTNYNHGVPGLADMLGAISLHVHDVAPGLGKSIHPGRWEAVKGGLRPRTMALRSDFNLDLEMPGTRRPPAILPVDRARLTENGQFLIEHPDDTLPNLVHRSRNGDIVSTPIQVDDTGLFFIDRWGKKDQRFVHLETLVQMLEADVNLRQVK
ncbi:membrane-targeted effector domain-containing toxin [Pseudomonas sp.]|uniref:membrane-targeted effector domain-containing toxin n=1 Tax=Pseudomonas sp. TaxID=306 RepID=UPI002E2FA818|nr:membrane-targeted effector domain-containing toxin [Pseudomonas sp.]HEX4547563.1 membrane-targeted effector domain-containing toxin [Pseudomonas sp.]